MTVTLDLTFLDALPVWAWVALGAAVWYAVAACVVRWTPYGEWRDGNVLIPRTVPWLLSPVALPLSYLMAATEYALTPRKAK